MSAAVINFRTGKPLERASGAAPTPVRRSAPAALKRKRGSVREEQRKALLAKIHVAKKQLGLTDEEYRAMLDGHFSAASAAVLGLTDLKRLVLVMQEYGFTPIKGRARRGAISKKEIPATLTNDDDNLGRVPLMKKIEALLTEKGRLEGTHVPWGYAVAILKRQSGGVTRCFEHATPEQLRGVIAALTYDARRKDRYAGSWGD